MNVRYVSKGINVAFHSSKKKVEQVNISADI